MFLSSSESSSGSPHPEQPMMPKLSPIRNPYREYLQPQLKPVHKPEGGDSGDSSTEEPTQSDSERSSQCHSELSNDNNENDDNQSFTQERNRALSSAARTLAAVAAKRDDSSLRQLATDMRAGKLGGPATDKENIFVSDPQPPPIALGKPPPHIHSQIPPIHVQPQHAFGKLVVGILKGLNLKAGQGVFGRADPYVKIKIGDREFTTSSHKDGGKNPEWKEEFEFEITTEQELEFEVMDKGVIGEDKFMGSAHVGILDWVAKGHFEGEVDLFDKLNHHAGQLAVSASFYRHGTYPQRAQKLAKASSPRGVAKKKGNTNWSTQGEEFSDKEIISAFQAFDLDKNNYVGASEIRHVLLNIGERPSDEEVDEMIRMVDKNGDGQVAFDEFYRMVTGGHEPPAGLRGAARQFIVGDKPINLEGLKQDDIGGKNSLEVSPQTGPEIVKARNAKRKALERFARDNYLKPESIKRAHRRFQVLDKKKSGVMDYTEFCEVLQVEPSVQCEEVFKMYDYNQSGLIDAKELLIALANFSGAGKDDKMKFAFMLYDEENTGSITHRELVKILRANHMAKSEAEVSRKAETIIAQCDKRNDSSITFDEFVVVSKKFPNILASQW
ncbi:hypothetical protein ACHAW5_001519 [Stephanodiscus triporus]|uniref:Calmodulin n=1 Tax=Stephanodiscus triporus TaxID=2934178 RepID=A0ABD3P0X3_9STRA